MTDSSISCIKLLLHAKYAELNIFTAKHSSSSLLGTKEKKQSKYINDSSLAVSSGGGSGGCSGGGCGAGGGSGGGSSGGGCGLGMSRDEFLLMESSFFTLLEKAWFTDKPMDGRMDLQTDRPYYRDARKHLKTITPPLRYQGLALVSVSGCCNHGQQQWWLPPF